MKVISFCLWSSLPKYNIGAIKNAVLSEQIYPGWQCWFYCGNDVPQDTLDKLSAFEHIKIISLPKADNTLMFDRFRVAGEKDIEAFIIRDCDSRLSLREKAAIDEWLKSDYSFHCMRDHPYHNRPVLGAMWGMKSGYFEEFVPLMDSFKQEDRWQSDQDFLNNMIWPTVKFDAMQHDDGFYTRLWGGKSFPINREGLSFVGEIIDQDEQPNMEHRAILANYLRKIV